MINYQILADSITFYESKGFSRIESPWTVTKQVSEITKPPAAKEFQLVHDDNKVLIASGEQSFLYLYLKGFLPKGKFQTCTPCFRHDSFDTWHTKYFIKNELIITNSVCCEEVLKLLDQAEEFFGQYLPRKDITRVKVSDSQMDLEYKGIELGSYGIRSCDFLQWVYGTACAEPRLSSIINRDKIKL